MWRLCGRMMEQSSERGGRGFPSLPRHNDYAPDRCTVRVGVQANRPTFSNSLSSSIYHSQILMVASWLPYIVFDVPKFMSDTVRRRGGTSLILSRIVFPRIHIMIHSLPVRSDCTSTKAWIPISIYIYIYIYPVIHNLIF